MAENLSDDDKRIIQGCVMEGRIHEIPKQLKLWKLSDYEEKLEPQERRFSKAKTCLNISHQLVNLRINYFAAFQFAKEGIKCLIDCYFDPPGGGPDPIVYLLKAIKYIAELKCTELLPSRLKHKKDGQDICHFLIYTLPGIINHRCAFELLFFLLKKTSEHPNSGWLLQWDFSVSKSPITFRWILENRFYDSEVVSALLEHGMKVDASDIWCALMLLPDEDYDVFHKLVKRTRKVQSEVMDRAIDLGKIYFSAILCGYIKNGTKHDMYLKYICTGSSSKLIQLAGLLTPDLRAKLFCNLCDKKKTTKCSALLNSGYSFTASIMLKALNDHIVFILDESFELFQSIIKHHIFDINEVFQILHICGKKITPNQKCRAALILLKEGCDIEQLCIFHSARGTAIHGAVELCLRSGNKTELLSATCEAYKKKYPNANKFQDSSNSTPYHLLATFKEKDNTADLCNILAEFNLIDPTLKNRKNKSALQLALKANFNNSRIAFEKIVDKWNYEKGIPPDRFNTPPMLKEHGNCKRDLAITKSSQIKGSEDEPTNELADQKTKPCFQGQNNNSEPTKICASDTIEQTNQSDIITMTHNDDSSQVEVREELHDRGLEEDKEKQEPDEELEYHSLEDLIESLSQKPPQYFTVFANNEEDEAPESNEECDEEEIILSHGEYEAVQNMEKFEVPDLCDTPSIKDPSQSGNEYQDEEFDFSSLPWEIFISKQAGDFLRASKTSAKIIRDIKRKLIRIGRGERSSAICRHGSIAPEYKLHETYLYRSARIIWCEDIQFSESESLKQKKRIYCDVVKIIWITLKHTTTQLHDVIEKIIVSRKKSQNSVAKKAYRSVTETQDEVHVVENDKCQSRLPRMYQLLDSSDETHFNGDIKRLHPMPNLFGGEFSVMQYHPVCEFLNALLNMDPSKRECSISMSEEEHAIVKMPYGKEAILLCGRSGTGKTTTCIYRIWNEFCMFWNTIDINPESAMEDDHEADRESQKYLHQVFLTKSPVLCYQVNKEFDKLVISYEKLEKYQFDRKPLKQGSTISDKMFPLFMTARKFLFHLDLSLDGDSFFPRNQQTGELEVELNCDYDEDIDLDTLLEEYEDSTAGDQTVSHKPQAVEVNADYFCDKIWPKIQTDSTLDPLLVWTEIHSFIKGTVDAIESEKGYISREQYKDFGKKVAPTFVEIRDDCYDFFERYCKYIAEQKQHCFLFDENDLIFNVYRRLKLHDKQNPFKWHVDHFYIDEVQDFTQAELWLLLKCCRNPNGTFCTGDIAQSIMKGLFFRFEDLKSLFFKLKSNARKITVPKLHQLTENFRSHSGVLELAHSMVEILKKNFNSSFQDSGLPREFAMFEGPKPILLKVKSKDELVAVLLGNDIESSVSHELGAHQAIIVRSETARKQLPASLKDGIVLTVLEAKGLEFNDVLLYNFFSDSKIKKQWRLLYNLAGGSTEQEYKAVCRQLKINSLHPLRVDENQEKLLKSLSAELKHLYTAITRARMNLWIYDEGEDECKPFFYYSLMKNLARLVIPDETNTISANSESLMFAAPSANEQWLKQGDFYFKLQKWDIAMKCYQKGKCFHKTCLTQGYKLVKEARSTTSDVKSMYKKAARLFLCADKYKHEITILEKGIRCLQLAKQHEWAATLLEKMDVKKALEEWKKTKNTSKIEELTEQLKDFSGVIRLIAQEGDYGRAFLKAGEYDKSNIILDEDVKTEQMLYEYIRKKEGTKVDVSEALKSVSNRSIKATLLRETGRLEEAADELSKDGYYDQAYRILEANDLFEKGYHIAKNENDAKAMFLLYHVTSLIVESKWKKTDEIIQKLKQLQKPLFRGYFQARSQILLGIVDINEVLLREAMKSFEKYKCLPAGVLAYNSLKLLKIKTNPIEEDLYYSKAAYRIAESLATTNGQQNLTNYEDLLRVHDIKHQGERLFISRFLLEQNICQPLKELTHTSIVDKDGMLELDTVSVNEILRNYYSELAVLFLKQSSYFTNDLQVKLKTSGFHAYLKSNQCGKQVSIDMDSYFKNLKNLIEYSSLTRESPEELHADILFQLFSPGTAFHLNATKCNFNFLKSKFVMEYFKTITMQFITDPQSTIEVYLTAFRLLSVFIGTFEANNVISKAMTVQTKYTFTHGGNTTHIFKGWFITCDRIQQNNYVTDAVWSVYNFFLKRIANLDHECKKEAISVASLNYIISVFSTTLFNMLAQQYQNQSFPLIFPRVYEFLLNNFAIFSRRSLLIASIYPVQSMYHTIWKQLNIFLSFLLGEDGSHYNVLYTALTTDSCIQNDSALFCLVQCLILAANLYCQVAHRYDHVHLQSNIQSKLVSIHKIVRDSKSKADFVTTAIDRLSTARNINDIFLLVSEILPTHPYGSELISPKFYYSQNNYSTQFELCYTNHYPSVPLKSLTVMQPSNETGNNSQQENNHVIEDVSMPSSPGTELTELLLSDEQETSQEYEQQAEMNAALKEIREIISDGVVCRVCGTIKQLQEVIENDIEDVPKEYKLHIESSEHINNVAHFSEYTDVKTKIGNACAAVKDEIESIGKPLVELLKLKNDLDRLNSKLDHVYSDTVKNYDWPNGIDRLQKCFSEVEQYKIVSERLKEKCKKRTNKIHKMDEEQEIDILPTKDLKLKKKRKRKH